MPPSTRIQSRISAFEALSRPPPPPPSSSSLIDLHEWVVDDGGRNDTRPAPPLPPRKPSYTSLKSVASSSGSLVVDLGVDHTYPPLDPRSRARHAAASSISSLHSVSLSSDTPDAVIDDESYEQVSLSKSKQQQQQQQQQQQKVPPHRPSPAPPPKRHTSPISRRSTSSPTPTTHKQPPPPPPPPPFRSSPTHLNVKRPTPVPPAARTRYDAVFISNILQRRRAENQKASEKPPSLSPEHARGTQRRAAGWRGLSVDLIGHDAPAHDEQISEFVGPTEKLQGRFVKPIWRRSRLGRKTLAEIWNECDPDRTGSLTRDQFARGMWRIDEELRRAQVQALKSTSTGSLGSLRRPPAPKIKPILR